MYFMAQNVHSLDRMRGLPLVGAVVWACRLHHWIGASYTRCCCLRLCPDSLPAASCPFLIKQCARTSLFHFGSAISKDIQFWVGCLLPSQYVKYFTELFVFAWFQKRNQTSFLPLFLHKRVPAPTPVPSFWTFVHFLFCVVWIWCAYV